MLGADINQLDPECIIDTDQFVVSLRKEFQAICERSISKGEIKLKWSQFKRFDENFYFTYYFLK